MAKWILFTAVIGTILLGAQANTEFLSALRAVIDSELKELPTDEPNIVKGSQTATVMENYDDRKCLTQLYSFMNGLNKTQIWAIKGKWNPS